MRRMRLRWRLAFSHAILAVVVVAFAGNRLEAQSRVADRARAVAVAERDADSLASRAARVFDHKLLLDDLVADEKHGSRDAEVVSTALQREAGSDLAGHGVGRSAVDRVVRDGTPGTGTGANNLVVAASPIVVGSVLVGAALVAEIAPASVPGLASFGVSNWLGICVVLVAAGAGWFLAGVLSRPIAKLTDDAAPGTRQCQPDPNARHVS